MKCLLLQKWCKCGVVNVFNKEKALENQGILSVYLKFIIYKVKAVDTTAAGDTFCGYFLSEITKGREIPEILKTASAASAIAVSRNGAAPSLPEYEEVEKFLAECG